jgi:hypothetical protein
MENVNETNSNPVEQPATEPVIEPVAPLPFWAKLPRRNLIVIAALILITIILLTLSLFPETSVKQEANNPIPTPTQTVNIFPMPRLQLHKIKSSEYK